MRENTQKFQALAFESSPGEIRNIFQLLRKHFVQDNSNDFDSFLLEESLVDGDFINRFANASLSYNDHLGFKNFRDPRVGKIKDRAHSGMSGTFAEHEILFPRDTVKGLLNFLNQGVVI